MFSFLHRVAASFAPQRDEYHLPNQVHHAVLKLGERGGLLKTLSIVLTSPSDPEDANYKKVKEAAKLDFEVIPTETVGGSISVEVLDCFGVLMTLFYILMTQSQNDDDYDTDAYKWVNG